MGRHVSRGFIAIISGQSGVVLVSFLVTPLLVRFLGSSLYGDYALILSILGIVMIIINAGIFDGARKFVAEDRDIDYWAEHVIGFYLQTGIVLAVIGGSILVLFGRTELVGQTFGQEFRTYFYLLAILIFSRQLFFLFRSGLMGLNLEQFSESLDVVRMGIFGIVGLFLAFMGYGVSGVLLGHIFGSICAVTLAIVVLRRHLQLSHLLYAPKPGFPGRELLTFNALTVVFILLTASLYHVDILLLQPLAGSQQTGYYKAALMTAEFLWFVPFAAQIVLLHSSSELWANEEQDRITKLASDVTRYTVTTTVLLIIGITALADSFFPIYFGDPFEAAIVPMLILLPGAFGFAVARPIFAISQGKGELIPLIFSTGAAAVCNILLNILLIPPFGMVGAATATSIGYGLMLVLHVRCARRVGFDPVTDLRLFRLGMTAAVSIPVIFGLDQLIASPLLSLLVVPPIGFVVYAIFALRTRLIDPEEAISAISHLPQPVPKYGKQILNVIG